MEDSGADVSLFRRSRDVGYLGVWSGKESHGPAGFSQTRWESYEVVGTLPHSTLHWWRRQLWGTGSSTSNNLICGRPFVKRVHHMLLDRCSVCPVCLSCLWRWCIVTIVAKWLDGSRWNLTRPHCVRWEPSSVPPPKRGHSSPSHFLAHVCRGQTAGWITMSLGTEVGRAADLFTELRNISRSKFYRIRIPL